MGGSNANQLIEFVRSFDPRSWSCLHISEGALSCNNVTVQNNDIGPCGSDAFQEWADGISVSCQNSLVRNNMVNNPTVSDYLGTMVYRSAHADCVGRWHRTLRRPRNRCGKQHHLGGECASCTMMSSKYTI